MAEEQPRHLVRASDLDPADAVRIRHPLNPDSEVSLQRLAERTGMSRVVVTLARVPPGKESFVPHAHLRDEEFLYILDGSGMALIGDAEVPVGPGDFMGFPTDGTVHHLRNTGATDLVYLIGGERSPLEVARFPTAGKIGIVDAGGFRLFDEADGRRLGFADFAAKG